MELSVMVEMLIVYLPRLVATSHLGLLSTWNVASGIPELNFKFYLILFKLLHVASGYSVGQHRYREEHDVQLEHSIFFCRECSFYSFSKKERGMVWRETPALKGEGFELLLDCND